MSPAATVKQLALEIGFDLAGIAPLAAWKDLEFSREWVERGYGGEMRYLENPKRRDPRSLLPSAQSVVCVGLVYNAPLPYSTEVASHPLTPGPSPRGRGEREDNSPPYFEGRGCPDSNGTGEGSVPRAWISRYAWGRDYHTVMRAKLEKLREALRGLAPGVETRVYVDTGPVVERAFARLSGIGWMGKNTCLINERKGSWFFLGVILTSLALEPDLPAPDRCGSCTACLEACPTAALVEPYVMDASRCISYMNIELKGSIPEVFRAAMGANVFGCDICQDVCPWNGRSQESETRGQKKTAGLRTAATTTLPEFQPLSVSWRAEENGNELAPRGSEVNQQSEIDNRQSSTDDGPRTDNRFSNFDFRVSLFNPPLEFLAALSEDDFRRAFRDSPVKRAKYRGWLRNLCVAMGNSGDARLLPKLRELAAHSDPMVREHALWALARLDNRRPSRLIRDAHE